jgi:uncharacterized membrane protein (DUF2068 family)
MAEEQPSGKGEQGRQVKAKRAFTLYFIIAIKLIKGSLLLLLALGVYSLSDNNLPAEFRHLLEFLHLDPEKKFFTDLADRVAAVTPANLIWLARGTVIYSLFSLVEGVGLIFRISWAGWLAIGESAFFIPIEIFELVHRPLSNRSFLGVFTVLALNVLIVWYLFQNRERLFRHHKAK